jgi:hypothetical protein
MWHVHNEYGTQCHCDHVAAAFRTWLAARHGTLDALNDAWTTSFWSEHVHLRGAEALALYTGPHASAAALSGLPPSPACRPSPATGTARARPSISPPGSPTTPTRACWACDRLPWNSYGVASGCSQSITATMRER